MPKLDHVQLDQTPSPSEPMNPRILVPVGLLVICAALLFMFLGPESGPTRQVEPSGDPTAGHAAGTIAEEQAPEADELLQPEQAAPEAQAEPEEVRKAVTSELAGTWPKEETRWLDVQWVAPDGTPVDEQAWVVALPKSVSNRRLHDDDGPFAQLHAGTEPTHIKDTLAVARADASGKARLALPPSAEDCWIAVGGKYVYSLECKQVQLEGLQSSAELRPVLGAWISGRLRAPSEQQARDLTQVGVKLRWSLESNLQLGAAAGETLRREARANSEGRFEFHAVPVGKPQALTTESDSMAMGFGEDLNPVSGEHVRVELSMLVGGSISGRLVDPNGEVVADATVQAVGKIFMGNPTVELRKTKSDADGKFELEGVSPGLTMLRVTHDHYQDLLTSGFELSDGESRDRGDLTLDEGLAIAGTVFFPDGLPATGAVVKIEPDLSENLAGSPTDPKDYVGANNSNSVDEEGNFRISGAGPGPWAVTARLDISEESILNEPGLWSASADVIRAPTEDLSFVLAAPMQMDGQVLDGSGAPISAFKILGERAGTQWYMPPSEKQAKDFDDEEGRFQLTNLRAGDWTFTAHAEGFADSVEIKRELPNDQALNFVLMQPVRLAGQVLDPDGRPVAGAEVSQELEGTEVFEAMQGRGDWPKTQSDAEGNFLLEGLAPGAGSVLAKKDGFAPSEAQAYELAEGEANTELVLTMRRGGTISGEVFGADGKPSGGCMLILQMPTLAERRITNTRGDGTFEEAGLSPGQWQVQAFPGIDSLQSESGEQLDQATLIQALKMTMVQLEDEETKHVVLGEPPANPVQVHGRVTLGSLPVENAVVSFIPSEGGGMERLKITSLDSTGSYAVQVDEPGKYLVTVQVTSTTGRQNSLEFRRTIPEVEDHTLDFSMPLGRATGSVRGPDGQPRPGARVTLNMEGGLVFGTVFGGQYNETVADENGEFEISFLRPGNYAVAAGGAPLGGFLGTDAGLGRAVTSISVAEGQWVRDIDFELQEPGSVKGTVRDTNGGLVKGASIFVRDQSGRLVELFSMAQTNVSGGFDYPGLAPGDYTIIARSPTQTSPQPVPVTIQAGQTTEVTVLVEAGTMLLVTLIDKSGSDVPSRVSVLNAEGHEMNGMLGMTEIMERYNGGMGSTVQRVGPVAPGAYRVRAFAEDGRSIERTVTARGKPERKVKLRMK